MSHTLAPTVTSSALTRTRTRLRRSAHLLSLLSTLVAAAPITAQSTVSADTVSARTDLPLLRQADAARTRGAAPGGAIDTTRPTLHEFVDYACPSCREFTTTRGDSLRTLAGTLRFNVIYHVSPIPRLLRGPRAAEAAFCAGGLGGAAAYDRLHEHLFASQDAWRTLADGSGGFVEAARTAGVDTAAFRRCLAIGVTAPLIAADLRLAGLLAVEGTPTFIVSPPGRSDLGTRIVGDASMLRITQAVRDAERADDPEPNAGALLGRWVVDSIETFAWRAPVVDSLATALRASRATVARTMAELRARTLVIATEYRDNLTYTHQLRRAGRTVYEETGEWAVPGSTSRLASMTTRGTMGTYDRFRVVGRVGDRVVLERHFTSGASAGLAERVFLRAAPTDSR